MEGRWGGSAIRPASPHVSLPFPTNCLSSYPLQGHIIHDFDQSHVGGPLVLDMLHYLPPLEILARENLSERTKLRYIRRGLHS